MLDRSKTIYSSIFVGALALAEPLLAQEPIILKSSDIEKILNIEDALSYLEWHNYESFHGVEPVEVNDMKCKKVGMFKNKYFDCSFNKDIRIDDEHVKRYRISKKIFRNVSGAWTTDNIVKGCAAITAAQGQPKALQGKSWPQCDSKRAM